jgi:hypothetical protein
MGALRRELQNPELLAAIQAAVAPLLTKLVVNKAAKDAVDGSFRLLPPVPQPIPAERFLGEQTYAFN